MDTTKASQSVNSSATPASASADIDNPALLIWDDPQEIQIRDMYLIKKAFGPSASFIPGITKKYGGKAEKKEYPVLLRNGEQGVVQRCLVNGKRVSYMWVVRYEGEFILVRESSPYNGLWQPFVSGRFAKTPIALPAELVTQEDWKDFKNDVSEGSAPPTEKETWKALVKAACYEAAASVGVGEVNKKKRSG